jgi:outer membrane immunogenic protein
MRKLNLVLTLTLLVAVVGFSTLTAVPAVAQSIDAGVNYTYVHTNAPPAGCGCFALNGGSAWLSLNVSHSFSLVGEIASQHGRDSGTNGDLTLISFMVGPRYSIKRWGHFVPFGEILAGVAHASGSLAPGSADIGGSSNSFAMAAGGGLDVNVSEHFTVRAIQGDYFLTQFENGSNDRQNNFRLGFGLIFKFGNRQQTSR